MWLLLVLRTRICVLWAREVDCDALQERAKFGSLRVINIKVIQ